MGVLVSTLWSRLVGTTEYKIVMVGLHNAGKTTILYKLHLGDVIETQPTIGSNVEQVSHRNIRFQVWDLGGQERLRKSWGTYFIHTNAVILVVDSTDREHMPTVKMELAAITAHEDLANAVLLILANKQDAEGAMSAAEVSTALALHANKQHDWQIQACCALTGDGLFEGLDWIIHSLRSK
ncbi:hypothetical protein KFE25_000402 [Diacronema lutheri]|uniref:Uncharacterized protein n=1 Tax=Diacronema lutheri TaxID=2081491 RepID=A0A8J5XPV6_DIALT|nr:hypothetical protein KFE25_000402 [Diacronema lutheri]